MIRNGKRATHVGALLCLTAFAPLPWSSAITTGRAVANEVSPLSNRRPIELPTGQGRIIRFDQPVESVMLADPAVANVQVVAPDVVYVYGLKSGSTNLIALDEQKRMKGAIRLDVLMPSRSANQAKNILQPTSTVDLQFFGERLVIKGATRSVDEAIDVANVARTYSPPDQPPLNNATIPSSHQVNIRVRFAEMSRKDLTAFGINWKVMVDTGNFSFGVGSSGGNLASGGRGLGLNFSNNRVNVDALVEAMQQNGLLTILAEPNLTATTGQTASFLAGGEVPVPVPQDRDRITAEYKPFGVSLSFTPTLLQNNRIGLRVRPEVSAISMAGAVRLGGFELPAFTVRRADTNVEVGSGQTFAIAGLFQRNLSQEVDKFPFLGDVPILGALFTSTRYRRDETELVILITAYLVKPSSDRLSATPLDRPIPVVRRRPVATAAPVAKGPRADAGAGLVFK